MVLNPYCDFDTDHVEGCTVLIDEKQAQKGFEWGLAFEKILASHQWANSGESTFNMDIAYEMQGCAVHWVLQAKAEAERKARSGADSKTLAGIFPESLAERLIKELDSKLREKSRNLVKN